MAEGHNESTDLLAEKGHNELTDLLAEKGRNESTNPLAEKGHNESTEKLPTGEEFVMVDKEQKESYLTLEDQIKGVLYGNCIGDAIGLLTEFMSKRDARECYGQYQNLEYNMKIHDPHRARWKIGDWTDDSDQMILILRTLVKNNGNFNVKDFAKKLHNWVYYGYKELGDNGGNGLGSTTASVLHHPLFLKHPHKAATDVWEGSGRVLAPNGGVMRTSIIGTLNFTNLEKVKEMTRDACLVTHADPRCIASCVAVTIAIALMLQRKYLLNNGKQDVVTITKIAYEHAKKEIVDERHIKELKHHISAKTPQELELDDRKKIGYTFKCMGAGFWALRQNDFRKAIQTLTMEGGDADTNCAVAGALLGCKFGFKKLPQSWVNGLCHGSWLEKEVNTYLSLIGKTTQC
ncbi:ADP-ribosylarginine hydrolase Tri1-like [Xenia sp. Carnegie-2017]|uniref:ADP-ribosylarginine hydrolase Tri1-like n=1 Tax=Xenia sp. Carnegie-2017 TaxID=2897299 RepID=UPI001F037146|nr:ADP-ribosylarginine hydrolase Tri1-like [Xenia sp. Carnegie-2017]